MKFYNRLTATAGFAAALGVSTVSGCTAPHDTYVHFPAAQACGTEVEVVLLDGNVDSVYMPGVRGAFGNTWDWYLWDNDPARGANLLAHGQEGSTRITLFKRNIFIEILRKDQVVRCRFVGRVN